MRAGIGALAIGVASGIIASVFLLIFTGPEIHPAGWITIGVVTILSFVLSVAVSGGTAAFQDSSSILSRIKSKRGLKLQDSEINSNHSGDTEILSRLKTDGSITIAGTKIYTGQSDKR